MKKLIVINGTMGVGKSTVCKELNRRLQPSVWLDGDWCWMMNPWVFSDDNKSMVQDNITHLLKNFLRNPCFDYVIFNWVIHQEAIFDLILSPLDAIDFELIKISLVCSEKTLIERMIKDGRDPGGFEESVKRLKLYETMDTVKIDTTESSIEETVDRIIAIVTKPQ